MRFIVNCFILVGLLSVCSVQARPLPIGMSFIGLDNDEWKAYIVDKSGKLSGISLSTEPRELTWSPSNNRLVYVRADGSIIEKLNNQERILVASNYKDAFTQIHLTQQGKELIAIRLVDKKSLTTALSVWDEARNQFVDIHRQLGKIFDPSASGDDFLFTVVSCMLECGGIVQEGWIKNRKTRTANQFTLHNGLLRYPVKDRLNKRYIYSLRKSNYFQIWQTKFDGTSESLTQSSTTELWPSVTNNGEIYFVRRDGNRGQLIYIDSEGEELFPLDNIKDIRDLEINL